MTTIGRPDATEHAPYYSRYIDLVPEGNIITILSDQIDATIAVFQSSAGTATNRRPQADKWSLNEILGHVTDAERVFAFRALWIARGDQSPLPGFEQDDWMNCSAFNDLPYADLIAALRQTRSATLSALGQFPDEAWMRSGICSGNLITVRAAAYVIAGHELHHRNLLSATAGPVDR